MAMALDTVPSSRRVSHSFIVRETVQNVGRCDSCRQEGRALSALVDWTDSASFDVCDGCLPD